MRTDFGDLIIDQAIVHVVPQRRRSDPSQGVALSETICTMNHDVRTALQGKLRSVLASLGREVVEDPNAKSMLPGYVQSFLAGERDLVDVSGEMVHLLLRSQTGVSPAGLLLVASARLAGHRSLLLVKLEQETGMQASETFTSAGLRTFDVKYFADLLFTEKSKVYKIALFPASGVTEDGLEGWAADRQMTKGMARFFLEKFLGCRPKDEPREVTRRFQEVTTEWINKYVADPDARVTYMMAAMTELQSAEPSLDPTAFAQKHLSLYHRDDYISFLAQNEIPPNTFDKDTELVEGRLKKLRVVFGNGISIIAPVDVMGDDSTVAIEDQGDGTATVTITGTVTTTSAYGTAGRRTTEKTNADSSGTQSNGADVDPPSPEIQ
ncbi:nucleoid-associated protein [Streptomyces sp. SID8499]|uniref:nucleoid-associated protein n=1 Tax=Streptomyces sp. SID8499 TaxID=2706106 RepID=UPI0013CA1095|nr:nucleoid-associated protein [Streptomyces sp. SID8499]